MNINEYFKELEDKVHVAYSVAEDARKKGLDPKSNVEVPLATSLAGRVAGLISTVYPQLNSPQIVNRILDLEKEYGALDPAICLKIAEEIAKEKFCKFSSHLEAIDAGIRVGMAYITLGVVSSPIEGFTGLKLKKTRDGKDYFAAYYSGPIRSAGGTGAAFSLVIIDYLREIFGYAKFDPDEKEIKRFVSELYDYHERITNLQYLPTEDEITFLAKNLPIQIDGDPSEEKEVSNYKDLDRVETNLIRSGVCLTLGEGLAQKAPKILRYVKKLKEKGFKLSDWEFLEGYVELHKKRESGTAKESPTYIQDLVAGRPVFGHPSASGAFRLRYGRSRNTGYSCLAIHPVTTYLLDGFTAIGTQLKIEMPTKGCALATCDSIEPPIVRMRNGSVRQPRKVEDALGVYKDVEEIIYLGDLLVPYGDFANRNHVLAPEGYSEQAWILELRKLNLDSKNPVNLDLEISNIYDVEIEKAIEMSRKFGVSLHPRYTYYWGQISYDDFISFLDWLANSRISEGKIILPFNKTEQERFQKGKRTLELLGILHEVVIENVILKKEDSKALVLSLGISFPDENGLLEEFVVEYCKKIKQSESVLDLINQHSLARIRDKAGTFIGSRMGRPEKAKLRRLVGNPNVLFPVGDEGGRLRSIQESVNQGTIKSDFPIYYCKKCSKETIYFICEDCGSECEKMNYCPECKNKFSFEKCPEHVKGQSYMPKRIDSKHYFTAAVKQIGMLPEEIPALIKGVRGTSNANHVPENLAKGFLRSFFKLAVNKDGTIRYDATELPLTQFKPKEIFVSVEKLRELGYLKDFDGKNLESEDQIVELFPHDIILPCCPDTLDEKADDVFMNISRFIDSLLVRFYKMKGFYNVRKREDLVGHLVCCIAPHNCAGVVGRIIGFSKTQGLLASPYMHAAMRRDCDGDEAAVMLLLDLLLNFSREFLPAHRGGTQDAPLVLNARIRAGEVDDMIFDIDVVRELPLELYEAASRHEHPSKIKIDQIKNRVGNKEFENLGYTHETDDFNEGFVCSNYKRIPNMKDKVSRQMELVEKIRAANTSDVARLIIERHFIRDIRGNLRKFSQQEFRCTKCNEKFRRPPLAGNCTKCGGNIIFTISEGSIIKYLEPALGLARKYHVPAYVLQNLELTKRYIESIFGRDAEKQAELEKWF
ncbi:MAG: DNA polymerase II large subunit [Nanoarchaeota archaeon]|nr:DNA polymerase II large subunit [Nanoarchaeota archaeon]MBU4086111.1 DNA polymerase II large subunit [Nanoarchaeota archaeon]